MRLVHVQRLARQVRRDFKVKQESKVSQERKPIPVRLVLVASREIRGLKVRLVRSDHAVLRDQRANKAVRAIPVLRVTKAIQALPVLGERQVQQVPSGTQEPSDKQALRAPGPQAPRDQRATLAVQAQKVIKVTRDRSVLRVRLVHRAQRGL